jgi:thiol-disulfide isomerase/thioredoxin
MATVLVPDERRGMKFFYIVLATMLLSVTDAPAADNGEALQKNFSKSFSYFYDFTNERRGVMPMTFVDENGKTSTMEDYKGKLVLLHFWATWCQPCIRELPLLKGLRDQKEGKDMAIVPVSLDYGMKPERLVAFMKRHNLTGLPVLTVPQEDKAWTNLTTFGLPMTFIVDPKGQILYKMMGDTSWANKDSVAFIDHLIATHKK